MSTYISDENYYLSIKNACKNKKHNRQKKRAYYIKTHKEELKDYFINYALHFYNMQHTPKKINDGTSKKVRNIIVPTMEEQVIHHMVVNTLMPMFTKGMYEHTYGSVPERGTHKAKKQIEKWIKIDNRGMKYCLKMDIRKYFDSIPHDIIKRKLSTKIRDKEFLNIVLTIIDATEVGLPLGFYTSQWFANWYLQDLDHYIKETLGAKHYIRFVDDMVIFDSNKRKLHYAVRNIKAYLKNELGLDLKDNWQIFLFDYVKDGKHKGRALDFLGFKFYRDRTILRKSIMLKATRKAKKIKKKERRTIYDARQMLAYLGYIDCTNTYNMYLKYIKPNVNFRYLKRYTSMYQKRINRRNNPNAMVSCRKRKSGRASRNRHTVKQKV